MQVQGAGWAMALLGVTVRFGSRPSNVKVGWICASPAHAFLPLDQVEHRKVDTVYSSFAAARPKLERNSLTSVRDPEENSFIASYDLSCGTCNV